LGPDGPGNTEPGDDDGDDDGPGRDDGPGIDMDEGPGVDWDGWGGGPGGGTYYGGGISPVTDPAGGGSSGGGTSRGGDPCEDVTDPEATVVIGYTTQSMQVGETQTLTVKNYHPRWSYENYHWEISSGGGTLSADVGFSVVYTAPDLNMDCSANPTINLICEGSIVDTLSIAVNMFGGDDKATEIWSDPRCVEVIEDIAFNCYLTNNSYDCEGHLLDGFPCELMSQKASCGACFGEAAWAACFSGGWSMDHLLAESPLDLRTDWMKTHGCCPEALL